MRSIEVRDLIGARCALVRELLACPGFESRDSVRVLRLEIGDLHGIGGTQARRFGCCRALELLDLALVSGLELSGLAGMVGAGGVQLVFELLALFLGAREA